VVQQRHEGSVIPSLPLLTLMAHLASSPRPAYPPGAPQPTTVLAPPPQTAEAATAAAETTHSFPVPAAAVAAAAVAAAVPAESAVPAAVVAVSLPPELAVEEAAARAKQLAKQATRETVERQAELAKLGGHAELLGSRPAHLRPGHRGRRDRRGRRRLSPGPGAGKSEPREPPRPVDRPSPGEDLEWALPAGPGRPALGLKVLEMATVRVVVRAPPHALSKALLDAAHVEGVGLTRHAARQRGRGRATRDGHAFI